MFDHSFRLAYIVVNRISIISVNKILLIKEFLQKNILFYDYSGKPTRILKPAKDIKTQSQLNMKILLTNKTPKSIRKIPNKAQRIKLPDRSNSACIKEPERSQWDATKQNRDNAMQNNKHFNKRMESTDTR